MIATLRQRNFLLLWLGGLVSVTGDWVLNIGLPIYVYLLTHSVLALSLVLLSVSVPSILLGPVAGVFVDRWNRKRTLVVINMLLGLGLLPLLLVTTPDRIWILYVVGFVEACLEQFFIPAQNALLPTLVDEKHLVPANALNALSSNLARLVGPVIGGLVAATAGLTGIVLADAVSFLIAALLITGIAQTVASTPAAQPASRSASRGEVGAPQGLWRDLVGGLRVIATQRTLLVLLTIFAFTMLGEGVFSVLYVVYVRQVLHGGALEIGELMSAQAVGGLLGGLLVGWVGKRMLSRWAIGMSMAAFGIIDLAIFNIAAIFALALMLVSHVFAPPTAFPLFWLAMGLFVAVGIPGIATLTGMQSLLQAASPEDARGRIFGALGMVSGLFRLVGVLIAGAVTDRVGLVAVLNVQGVGYVLAGLLAIALLPRRRARGSASGPTEENQEGNQALAHGGSLVVMPNQ